MAENKKNGQKKKLNLQHIFSGKFISDFLKNHLTVVLIIVAIFLLRIANEYYCLRQHTEMGKLQKSIDSIRVVYLTISKEEMNLLRESEVAKMVKNANLTIKPDNDIPYILEK